MVGKSASHMQRDWWTNCAMVPWSKSTSKLYSIKEVDARKRLTTQRAADEAETRSDVQTSEATRKKIIESILVSIEAYKHIDYLPFYKTKRIFIFY